MIPLLTPQKFRERHFAVSENWTKLFLKNFNQFLIERVEQVKDQLKFPLPPHRKTIYDFIFLTKGSTVRSKGLENYELEKNSFFFLPAYQITTNEYVSEDAEGFYCHFDLETVARNNIKKSVLNEFAFLQFTGNPIVAINSDDEAIKNILLRLESIYINNLKNRNELIQFYLLTLFTELKSFTKPLENRNTNSAGLITQHFKDALVLHIYEKQLVTEYADLLSVSPNHLNKCVKASTGRSPQDWIKEMVLLEAKVLLKQTSLSISEIAYQVGKQDPSDFGRFFKAQTGLTPSEYRKMD